MSNNYPRIILAGTHSGVGKTTITLGVLLALKNRGICVQPYKIGPDYIDAGFHSRMSGRICRNLDSFFLPRDVLLELFQRSSQSASLSLIEGVMGMYDGLGTVDDIGSTAHVAKILRCPVILIVDSGKMAASSGAVVLGYKKFDAKVNIAGCIVNRVAGPSHYQTIKASIEKKSGVKVLGYFPKNLSFTLPERHLGLTPVQEIDVRRFAKVAKVVEEFINVDMIVNIGKAAPALPNFKKSIFITKALDKKITIAVARDKSFHFYYQDNLDMLEHFGAKLEFFSPLKSKFLPKGANGVYIGGGFPEVFAKQLAANESLRKDIKHKSREGIPVYAECGGLIYLMREVKTADKKIFPMMGIFPGRVQMGSRLQMFGYYDVKAVCSNIISNKGAVTKGHVFHWSYVTGMSKQIPCAFRLERRGKVFYDGYMKANTIASYLHIHFGTNQALAKKFLESCFKYSRGANSGK